MSQELKPCPFCGEDGIIMVPMTDWEYFVECQNNKCRSCGPVSKTKRNAINAWNRRHDNG